jgi:hypothetical protein
MTMAKGICHVQVYSIELVTTLGNACKRLLDELAAALERSVPSQARQPLESTLAPRLVFILLQSPLNSDASGIGTCHVSMLVPLGFVLCCRLSTNPSLTWCARLQMRGV